MEHQVILAYTSAGLGHLRVTNALFEAAPAHISPRLLRAKHGGATAIHRFSSVHPVTRAFMEWSQNGWPEEFFTRTYRFWLRRGGSEIEESLRTILEEQFTVVKRVVVVATHFGLAHQIASSKARLEREIGVKIELVVVVTDDSPQKLWYVAGSDLILVPSEKTKQSLVSYANQRNLPPVSLDVCAYPLSPRITGFLKPFEWRERENQLNPAKTNLIQVLVPISGAAVSLVELESLMKTLYRKNPRFHFYVVSRENIYTKPFLERLSKKPYISLVTSIHDREVVTYYNKLIETSVFSFEITKPSEQSFKAILSSRRRGGMISLLMDPVGRQEQDNVQFLTRHGLMGIHSFALPSATQEAASFILNGLTNKMFLTTFKRRISKKGSEDELSSHGAARFWKKIEELLKRT